MSSKATVLIPPTPNAARGFATKLSAGKGKISYANGRSVILYDLENPGLSFVYSEHVQNTTVARISPSGYYCASADVVGNVRVWDIVGEDKTLKGEYRVISGKVNDLAWDGESKRIIAVGDGRERFGHAFMMDTGTSTGEIGGHSKAINAVSIRQQRPYRAATAGDDAQIIFHQGAPYKYEKTIKTHTRFVQDLRYSPSGDHFVSVGSDSKFFIYDGKTGDTLGEFTEGIHTGSIMGCSWSPDNTRVSTSSADCTVKLWDVETKKAVSSWTVGSGVSYQQVGNVWSGDADIVSLSVSGELSIFDPRSGTGPARVIYGAQKAVTAISSASDDNTLLAGTADGRILSYDTGSATATPLSGDGHTNLVSGLAASGTNVFSVGFDDKLREIDAGSKSFTPASLATSLQPRAVAAASDSTVFVAEAQGVEVIKSNQKVHDLKTSFAASSVAVSGSTVAVGGEDQKVRLYEWDGKTLKETATLEGNKGVVCSLAFSPDATLLLAGDSSGKLILFDTKENKLVHSRWTFHSARVNSLSWTADSKHCASGSLDTHIYIWSVEKPLRNIPIKNAIPGGVNGVWWLGPNKLAGTGADGTVRVWEVKFH